MINVNDFINKFHSSNIEKKEFEKIIKELIKKEFFWTGEVEIIYTESGVEVKFDEENIEIQIDWEEIIIDKGII